MADDSQPQNSTAHFVPHADEMRTLAKILPINGVDSGSNRVFNIWGENGVGKSSFISQFRESELMSKSKVLWLQPTLKGEIDTIPEFIEACSKTIRYPASPEKEKKIASALESAQRGKVNPVVSDDTLLITRSSVAKDRKKYVNQAAASSVGRTELIREDIEINVGLGESKHTNHAEGFLDALPLQSLGTNLTVIYIEKFEKLSISVVDWLRDYVFPTATRGPYRRSLVFLLESEDPIALAYPTESWGEWSNRLCDFRLSPLNEYDVARLCSQEKLEKAETAYVTFRSLGYPEKTTQAISSAKSISTSDAVAFLEGLPESDQTRVAAMMPLENLYPDELDTIFGHDKGRSVYNWFRQLPGNLSTTSSSGKSVIPSESLRLAAISKCCGDDQFLDLADKAKPLAKLQYLVPAKSDRSKLLLLSGLDWIDAELCELIFGEQAGKIIPFISSSPALFTRNLEKYRISERIRTDLQETATLSQHPGIEIVAKKAAKLWQEREQQLKANIASLEDKIGSIESEITSLLRKQSEFTAQIRIQQRETDSETSLHDGQSTVSKWLRFGKGSNDDSSQGLRQNVHELSIKINEHESEVDQLKAELSVAKSTLKFPYVEDYR